MANFTVNQVTPVSLARARITYSANVKAYLKTDATDALNPANYVFTGPAGVKGAIDSIAATDSDPTSVDIYFHANLGVGAWELQTANVTSDLGEALVGINRTVFTVTAATPASVTAGVTQNTALSDLLNNMPSSLQGANWLALLTAIANGDQTNREAAELAFAQLFIPTASGIYLDKRLAEVGITRDPYLGISDEAFRKIGLAIYQNKLVRHSFWKILAAYYGEKEIQAYQNSGNVYPFAYAPKYLADGDYLLLEVDRGETVKVVFNTADFTDISAPTAVEISNVINKTFNAYGINGYCISEIDVQTGNVTLGVYSKTMGFLSQVRVVGGSAQYLFRFPTYVTALTAGTVWSWAVNSYTGVVTATYVSGGLGSFASVATDDYVVVNIPSLASTHSGTFTVTNVVADPLGGVYSFQYVNQFAVAGSHTLATAEVFFGRPVYALPLKTYVANANPNELLFNLPVTSIAVGRNLNTGSYLNNNPSSTIALLARDGTGLVTVDTDSAHSLTAGDWIFVDDAAIDSSNLQAYEGWSLLPGVMSTPRRHHTVTQLNSNEILVIGGYTGFTLNTYWGPSDATNTVEKYNLTTKTWTTLAPMASARAFHSATLLSNGKVLVCGGKTTSTNIYSDAELYDPSNNTWVPTANTMHSARWGFVAIELYNDNILVAGGNDYSTYELYYPSTNTFYVYDLSDTTGAVSNPLNPFVLPGHGLTGLNYFAIPPGVCGVHLPFSNNVFIAGGGEGLATKQTFYYNEVSNTWAARAFMPVAGGATYDAGVTFATAIPCYMPTAGLQDGVVLRGGFTKLDPDPANCVPYYRTLVANIDYQVNAAFYARNIDTWLLYGPIQRTNPANMTHGGYTSSIVLPTGSVLTAGGGKDNTVAPIGYGWADKLVPLEEAIDSFDFQLTYPRLGRDILTSSAGKTYVVGGDSVGTIESYPRTGASGRLNGLFKVNSVISPTQFTYYTPDTHQDAFGTSGVITPVAAKAGTKGPHVFDKSGGISITDIYTTVTTKVSKGGYTGNIQVADATDFPDTTGWIYLGYGTASAQGPIKYLGKNSATEILVDSKYKFVFDAAVGTKVSYLYSKGAWVPDNISLAGGLYLTGSQDARGSAESNILDILAAGTEYSIKAVYPSDRGLGAEGSGSVTGQKMSSVVEAFKPKGA